MNRARPLALLLPALALAGCCCERTPRRDPCTIVCPSPAPQPSAVPTPAPTATSEATSPCVRPPRLAPAAPSGTPAPAPEIPNAASAGSSEKRTLMAVSVADVVETMPIDTLVERLRAALPGTEVNRQGTVTITVRGTQDAHAKVGAWLAQLRMDAMPPK